MYYVDGRGNNVDCPSEILKNAGACAFYSRVMPRFRRSSFILCSRSA